jgi:hypothetical protein
MPRRVGTTPHLVASSRFGEASMPFHWGIDPNPDRDDPTPGAINATPSGTVPTRWGIDATNHPDDPTNSGVDPGRHRDDASRSGDDATVDRAGPTRSRVVPTRSQADPIADRAATVPDQRLFWTGVAVSDGPGYHCAWIANFRATVYYDSQLSRLDLGRRSMPGHEGKKQPAGQRGLHAAGWNQPTRRKGRI